MNILYTILEWIMNRCYFLCNNYGLAIILFTLISKIILLPVSVWVQKNAIKMVKMQPDINFIKVKFFGDKDTIAEEQSKLFKEKKYNPMASIIPLAIQIILLIGLIEVIKGGIGNPNIKMDFFGIDLSLVPSSSGVSLIWSPLIAGFSAWILCVAQNANNVLQSEQSKWSQYGMMIFLVALSLYLGWLVSIGVALYWVTSNIMAVLQLYLLNWWINPRDYVDYARLEESKKELEELGKLGRNRRSSADKRRERQDYKQFFKVVNKHLVFYSESSGFYKYFRGVIAYLLEHTNIQIHYITSDPRDIIFEISKSQEKIHPYYIGEKRLITLMMKMEADVVVMTMPDLNQYHIKRSYIRKDIEYIYVPHTIGSINLTMRTGSVDYFDTVFCVGKHQVEEMVKTENAYGLPKKTLVECGYPLLDEMRWDYKKRNPMERKKKSILIAPSWQRDNIVDSCLEQMLQELKGRGYQITVRPHPQHVRHQPERMEQLKQTFAAQDDIEIQTDFSSNSTVFEADLMITDWSGVAFEYAFTTYKPVLFIDTPLKVMNPEYKKIDTKPINIWIREKIGRVIKPTDCSNISCVVADMFSAERTFEQHIGNLVEEYVYHLGTSSEVGAKHIIKSIQSKIAERKEKSL